MGTTRGYQTGRENDGFSANPGHRSRCRSACVLERMAPGWHALLARPRNPARRCDTVLERRLAGQLPLTAPEKAAGSDAFRCWKPFDQ